MTIAERIRNEGVQRGVDNTILALQLMNKDLSLEEIQKRTGIGIAHLEVLFAQLKRWRRSFDLSNQKFS